MEINELVFTHVISGIKMGFFRQTDRQTRDRQTNRQGTDRQTDKGQTDRQGTDVSVALQSSPSSASTRGNQ